MYKKSILWEIGEIVGKVVKLDYNTDHKVRGRYARMAIFIDLEKPLASKVLINVTMHRVEFESLPAVCFSCGRYGYSKEKCGILKGEMKGTPSES